MVPQQAGYHGEINIIVAIKIILNIYYINISAAEATSLLANSLIYHPSINLGNERNPQSNQQHRCQTTSSQMRPLTRPWVPHNPCTPSQRWSRPVKAKTFLALRIREMAPTWVTMGQPLKSRSRLINNETWNDSTRRESAPQEIRPKPKTRIKTAPQQHLGLEVRRRLL